MKMTRLVLMVCLLGCISTMNAQISVGVSASYGEAWQDYGDDFTPNNGPLKINSYRFSASVYYPLMSYLEIGVEPAFARRGAACEPGFVWGNPFVIQDATFEANYIELPFMLQGKFNVINDKLFIMPKIGGGPAYLVNAYREIVFINSETPGERRKVDFDQETEINRLDFGLHGGLSIGYQVGPGILHAEARYYHSLLDATEVLTSKNRSLQFGIGYRISL